MTDYYGESEETPQLLNPVHHFSTDILSDNDATVARVLYQTGKTHVHVTGSSKRERGDSYDRETGEALALARALEKLAAKLAKKAQGRIRHADSVRRHREQIAAKRAQIVEGMKAGAGIWYAGWDAQGGGGAYGTVSVTGGNGGNADALDIEPPALQTVKLTLSDGTGRKVAVSNDGIIRVFDSKGILSRKYYA